MKILILDPYPVVSYRVSKDTNGGFGTGNDYGDALVPRMLRWIVKKGVDWPSLYVGYVAEVLRKQGHQVYYCRAINRNHDHDLCLITSSIVAHETELGAIRQIAGRGKPIVAMGPFASTMAQAYIDAGACVITGEPEFYFLNNDIATIDLAELNGILAGVPSGNLDELPFPAWDIIFKTDRSRFSLIGGRSVMVPIAATRGCPYSCFHYCTYPLQQGRKVRKRSPESVVQEMCHWQDTLGANLFIFRDPVFALDRKHAIALCDALDNSERRFQFIVELHLANIDEELILRLIKSGLVMVKTGIETADTMVIEKANRYSLDSDAQIKAVHMIEGHGIPVTCMYMLGFPDDTMKSCRATIDYAKHLNSAIAQFCVFTPYPGTLAFGEYKNKIIVDRFEDFTQWRLIFVHQRLSTKDIRRLLDNAFSTYYLRPAWITRHLSQRILNLFGLKTKP